MNRDGFGASRKGFVIFAVIVVQLSGHPSVMGIEFDNVIRGNT